MAALTPSKTTVHNFPASGQYKIATYTVTSAGQSVTNEWIATGGREVLNVIGAVVNGIAGGMVNYTLNASGTSATEGANPGNLGVECSLSAAKFSITCIYR